MSYISQSLNAYIYIIGGFMKYFYTLEYLTEILWIKLENMYCFYKQGYLGKRMNVGIDAQ